MRFIGLCQRIWASKQKKRKKGTVALHDDSQWDVLMVTRVNVLVHERTASHSRSGGENGKHRMKYIWCKLCSNFPTFIWSAPASQTCVIMRIPSCFFCTAWRGWQSAAWGDTPHQLGKEKAITGWPDAENLKALLLLHLRDIVCITLAAGGITISLINYNPHTWFHNQNISHFTLLLLFLCSTPQNNFSRTGKNSSLYNPTPLAYF